MGPQSKETTTVTRKKSTILPKMGISAFCPNILSRLLQDSKTIFGNLVFINPSYIGDQGFEKSFNLLAAPSTSTAKSGEEKAGFQKPVKSKPILKTTQSLTAEARLALASNIILGTAQLQGSHREFGFGSRWPEDNSHRWNKDRQRRDRSELAKQDGFF